MSISKTTSWGYDTSINKIYRDKNGDRVYYTRTDERLGEEGSVYVLKPDQKGFKDKAVKMTARRGLDEFVLRTSIGGNFTGIQKVYKAFINDMIVMSKYDGNLKQLLPTLSAKWKISAIDQLLKGLTVLHEKDIHHRDIKMTNIFCKIKGEEFISDLGDFNISKRGEVDKQDDILSLGLVFNGILSNELESKDLPRWLNQLTSLMVTRLPLTTLIDYYNEQTNDR